MTEPVLVTHEHAAEIVCMVKEAMDGAFPDGKYNCATVLALHPSYAKRFAEIFGMTTQREK